MRGQFLLGVFTTLSFAIGPAGDAIAATVAVAKDRDGYNAVYYVAAPGEVNDVVVAAFRDSRVRIYDARATISANGRCRSIDPHRAVCPSFAQIAHVAAGDLNDRVRALVRGPQFAEPESIFHGGSGDDQLFAAGEFDRLLGGAGDDQLRGRDGGDELDGGQGADLLYGGGNTDRLNGGGGRDELFGGRDSDLLTDGDRDGAAGDAGPGPDTLVGDGPGRASWENGDTLSYEQRTQSVSVHAGVDENAGETGERDNISNIENLAGGSGSDRLVGDKHLNYLDGRGGADTVIGGGGKDYVTGGRGRDRLHGGRDPDKLTGGAGTDALFCGTPPAGRHGRRTPYGKLEPPRGDDVLIANRTSLREIVPRSCEQLLFDFGDFRSVGVRPQLTRMGSWWLGLRIVCPNVSLEYFVGCRGTVRVRENGGRRELLALGRFKHGDDGDSFKVPLAMTRRGYRWWVERQGRPDATVALRVSAETTPKRPFTWMLRRPGA